MQSNFDFITDDRLRDSLNVDYNELVAAMENRCWKAALVLAGSIVEAVILDTLLASDLQARTNVDPLKLVLANAIDLAKKDGFISQRTSELASVVRDYRNVIHPGRLLRTQDSPDEQTAIVARSLVDVIAKEISIKRQMNKGLTADQLVSKLEKDPGAAKLINHYTRSMSTAEIRRFLISSAENRFSHCCKKRK